MSSLLESKTLWFCSVAGAIAATIMLRAAPKQEPPFRPGPPQAAWTAPAGPGLLRNAPGSPDVPLQESRADGELPGGLNVDAGGQLIVNAALRNAYDFFLIRSDAPDFATAQTRLREYLDSNLPPTAAARAKSILEQYLLYMRAHDELIARQQLDLPPGALLDAAYVERLATWYQQRARLRESTFGIPVAQAWYASEDAQFAQTLASLRARAPLAAQVISKEESESNSLRMQRLHGAASDAELNNDIRQLAAQVGKSFAAAAAQERQWRAHAMRFSAELARLDGTSHMEPAQRRRAIDALRARIFSNQVEIERSFAQGLGNEPPLVR